MPIRMEEEMLELETAYQRQLLSSREDDRNRHSLEHGERILWAVERGDPDGVLRALEGYGPLGSASEKRMDLQEQRGLCIYAVGLMTWAAIRGGVPEEDAFALLHVQLGRLGRMTSAAEVLKLKYRLGVQFAQFTRSHAHRGDSPAVRQVREYVGGHLHAPVRVEEMAQTLGLRRNALAALFKRETGETLGEYIRREKMKEAKYLLVYSRESISAIAATLAYSSQSHFGAAFQKETGLSPKKYRETFSELCIFDKTG